MTTPEDAVRSGRRATGTARATSGRVVTAARRVLATAGRALAPVGLFVRRPVVVDTVVVAAFVGWSLLLGLGAESMYDLTTYLGGQVTTMQVVSLLLTVAGAVALSRRRRHPVPVAVAVGLLTLVSLAAAGGTHGLELAVACALHTVATARRPRTAWLVTGGVLLVVAAVARVAPLVAVVGTRVLGGDPRDPAVTATAGVPTRLADLVTPWWAVTVVPAVLLVTVAVAWGSALRAHRLHVAEAAAARDRDAAQLARLTRADERARVAREMHDVVAHSLTVMVALGGGAAVTLDRSPAQARVALDELVDTGRTALDDVRRILDVLHADEEPTPGQVVGAAPVTPGDRDDAGAPMAPQPGADDLARLVERFRTAGLPVRTSGLAVTGLDGVGATRQLAVYRVVQESLTNTLRHAPGTTRVDVDVHRDGSALDVLVTDAGPGDGTAPGAPGTRRGVVGMAERVAMFGGTVEAGPHGTGWRVHAHLPWQEADA
ncbi:sensor histidine kinase [Cellulomonas sp. B6]|uniref:sensor histidine kinase n=1 Tax=Cellulomonas sp. B6 TaxID=1295626 RepID=UPI00073B75B2|nr:histidine kinase [Cellulomonas sp. B6]KSW19042.1 hypothetical protein ATM99_16945 [Cellulomonas sp. B6]